MNFEVTMDLNINKNDKMRVT